MLMAPTIASATIKHDHLLQLRRFFEQIGLDEYYALIVEQLKVYSIGDLRYVNESDLLSLGMSKPQFRKIKRHLPSSSNASLSNNAMFTSTWGKLLVRKLTLRSTTNLTRSTLDLNNHYERQGSSITSLDQQTSMGRYQQQKNIISPQNIQLIEQIGEGEFGTVFKAFWRTKHNELLTVAVKRLNKLDQDFGLDDILKEVCVLQDIEHTHIVQFFGIVIQTDGSFMLVTEYAHGRSLYECLLSTNAKCDYTIEVLIEFLKQIASAMSYLEKKFLIHRDLASRNILVFHKSLVKLSDFGLSRLCCSETNYYKTSWKDTLRLPIAWMSPEAINFLRFTTASDVFSFGVCMWECFTYGQMPWQGKSSAEIVSAIDAPHHQRLPRPAYATTELYQTMLHCWKYEPSDRPTFSQLERTLGEIELKKVRWKEKTMKSASMPDGFLAVESCALGPLTIVDRCLNVPTVNNLIQCVAVDGQIGFVSNTDVEPLHIVSIAKPLTTPATPSTMSNFFHRKTEAKKNLMKTKARQLSKDMIGLPQADFIHAFHIGVSGETFGDVACLAGVEKTDLLKISMEKSPSTSTEFQSNYQQPVMVTEQDDVLTSIEVQKDDAPSSSLLDEVLQAFTEIYAEPDHTSSHANEHSPVKAPPKPERSAPTSPKSPMIKLKSSPIPPNIIDLHQSSSDSMTDCHNGSEVQHPCPTLKSPTKKSPDDSCRFTRELEQRLQNGDISEEAKNAYNRLINGCSSSSASPPPTSLLDEERSHCASHADLSSNPNELAPAVKPSPAHHPIAVLFGSSSSSSTSISTSSISNNTSSVSSSSSNRAKSDRHSHYSSTSTDNDISIDLKPTTTLTTTTNDLSPLKLLRNGLNPSNLLCKSIRQPSQTPFSATLSSSANRSPVSSNSNTLSNLSSASPLFDRLPSLPPSSSSSFSSSSAAQPPASPGTKNEDNQSLSSLQSRSLSSSTNEQQTITGHPMPPPPDLSSLGSKLTTATMTHTLKIPAPLTSSSSNAYRLKKRFNLFT